MSVVVPSKRSLGEVEIQKNYPGGIQIHPSKLDAKERGREKFFCFTFLAYQP